MKHAHSIVIPSIAALALSASALAATMQPLSSQRSVISSASLIAPGEQPTFESITEHTDMTGLFDESATATAQIPPVGAAAVTIATQQSTIETDFLHASGAVEMTVEHPGAIEAGGEGISFFSAQFLVTGDTPVELQLTGTATAEPAPTAPGHSKVQIHLFPPGGASLAPILALPGSPQEFDQTITLAPGQYTLSIFADLVLFHPDSPDGPPARETAHINFDLTLTPADAPSIPGDTDDDGDVDFDDLLIVLAGWGDCDDLSNCPADVDQSGDVTFADLLIVLSNWT